MKTSLIALAIMVVSASATATETNYKFVAENESMNTSLCVTAAKDGFAAALEEAFEQGVGISEFATQTKCNGMSVKRFANKYHQIATVPAAEKKIKLVAANENAESQLCIKAVKHGVEALADYNAKEIDAIFCNGRKLSRFAKLYGNKS